MRRSEAWFSRDRVALRHGLLKVLLVFTLLPIGSTSVRADGQPVAKGALDWFGSVPIIKLAADSEVLSGEGFHIQWGFTQSHSPRDESARVFRRSGMSGDSDIREAQVNMPGNVDIPIHVSSGDVAAVDYVHLNKRAIADIANGDVGLQYGGLGGRKLLSAEHECFSGYVSRANRRISSSFSFLPREIQANQGKGGDKDCDASSPGGANLSPVRLWPSIMLLMGSGFLYLWLCGGAYFLIRSAGTVGIDNPLGIVKAIIASAVPLFGLLIPIHVAFTLMERIANQ